MKKIIVVGIILGGLLLVGNYFYTKEAVLNEVAPALVPATGETATEMSFFITSVNPG